MKSFIFYKHQVHFRLKIKALIHFGPPLIVLYLKGLKEFGLNVLFTLNLNVFELCHSISLMY